VIHTGNYPSVRTCPRDLIVPRIDHPDLKLENVPICIDDVESSIQSELAISCRILRPHLNPTYQTCRCPTVKRPRGEPNPTPRVYLDTQFPTTAISIFFVRLESIVGQFGFWDEYGSWGGEYTGFGVQRWGKY
jgi:hypothetical protein